MNHIELRHLRYFLRVAEERSFTKAAARLHISQPPLSRQIRFLEEELQVQLFRRTKRSVILTEAGAHFLKKVHKILEDADSAALQIQAVARGDIGELTIGVLFSASLYHHFSKTVRDFRRRYPGVRLIFKEVPYDQGLRLLHNRDVDLCFQRPFEVLKNGKTLFQIFADDYLELCLSRNHPLARKKSIVLSDLRDELFLINPDQTRSFLFEKLQSMANQLGIFLNVYKDTTSFPIIANLVAAQYGVAFLPPTMRDAAHGDIIFRKLTGISREICHQPLVLAYRRDDKNLPLKNFLAVAKAKKLS